LYVEFEDAKGYNYFLRERERARARDHFQQYFSYNVAASVIDRGNRSFGRKPPTIRKSLINFIT